MNYLSVSKIFLDFLRNIHTRVEYLHIVQYNICNRGRTQCSPSVAIKYLIEIFEAKKA